MINPWLQQQIDKAQAMADRLAPELERIQQSVEETARIAREFKEQTSQITSYFEQVVLFDRSWTYFQKIAQDQKRMLEWAERGRANHLLVSIKLPKRGWYLSGKEPCTLTDRLANAIRDGDLDVVDKHMMKHLPEFKVDTLRSRLSQEGVPDYCVNRVCRFLKHHEDGNYEEATYLGVPLLDEVAKYLYRGKAFTTKRANRSRGDQSKPELAIKTVSGPDLGSYCDAFVQAFGSLQENPDQKMLTDENYWNRHAIVHGLMQRPMGIKDSAKCLMAINFLLFARKEEGDVDEEQPT